LGIVVVGVLLKPQTNETTKNIYLDYHTVVPVLSLDLGLPNPLSCKRVFGPPLPGIKGRETHSLAGDGVAGVQIPTIGEKAWYSVYSTAQTTSIIFS
jgi:hypothetical protein